MNKTKYISETKPSDFAKLRRLVEKLNTATSTERVYIYESAILKEAINIFTIKQDNEENS